MDKILNGLLKLVVAYLAKMDWDKIIDGLWDKIEPKLIAKVEKSTGKIDDSLLEFFAPIIEKKLEEMDFNKIINDKIEKK